MQIMQNFPDLGEKHIYEVIILDRIYVEDIKKALYESHIAKVVIVYSRNI